MTSNDLELFAWLRGNPRFVAWLDVQERAALAVLKQNPADAALYRAQGEYRLIDRMRDGLAAADKRAW